MNLTMRSFSMAFAAGLLGGLLNCLAVWLFGRLGIAAAFGVKIAPPLTATLLYSKLVWGGLWGFLFLVPLGRLSFPASGLLFSLGPSLAQLFVVFPLKAHQGVLGLQLGALTPLFVLFYNIVWGITAGWWLQLVGRNED